MAENNSFGISQLERKPAWIRVKPPLTQGYASTLKLVRDNNLHTVCEEAACPNIGECWDSGHATVMILGHICTRACTFCNVITGKPQEVDPFEPDNVANAVSKLKLSHVVVTSVDRDDLDDGGASQFVAVIERLRVKAPEVTIEILIPDFLRKDGALKEVVNAGPDILNHNIETVPRLYKAIRPGARYFHSLQILAQAKDMSPNIFTKSGLMVGLGEHRDEVLQVMDDMRAAKVDMLTIGQYLQPTLRHRPVDRYVTPREFKSYHSAALSKGFLFASCTPLTRSSYHAGDNFSYLRRNREMAMVDK